MACTSLKIARKRTVPFTRGVRLVRWVTQQHSRFCQDKIITTGGEGGLLALDDEKAWKRAWAYKDIGRSYDAVFSLSNSSGVHFRWLIESFGTNWRMTEMQAALGRIQLRRLPESVAKRRRNAERLRHAMQDLSVVRCPWPSVRSSMRSISPTRLSSRSSCLQDGPEIGSLARLRKRACPAAWVPAARSTLKRPL